MDKLVSCWSDGKRLPKDYVLPPEIRPGQLVISSGKNIPLIDLSKADGEEHKFIVQQTLEASQGFGFFQIINHGVPTKLMDDARHVFKDFFELQPEEKAKLYTMNIDAKCMVYTSNLAYEKEEIHVWRDAVRLTCTPLRECMEYWPEKPLTFRKIAAEYVVKMQDLGSRILQLISEGLGLEPEYFENGLSQDPILTVNHYPPCPYPNLTLGAGKHFDPSLITILLQDHTPGLQVLKDDKWMGVEPIPEAFVVNMGQVMQIVTNGKLKGVEHRAVTNANKARTSAAFFITPRRTCDIKPADALVTEKNPPIYKCIQYENLFTNYREIIRRKD